MGRTVDFSSHALMVNHWCDSPLLCRQSEWHNFEAQRPFSILFFSNWFSNIKRKHFWVHSKFYIQHINDRQSPIFSFFNRKVEGDKNPQMCRMNLTTSDESHELYKSSTVRRLYQSVTHKMSISGSGERVKTINTQPHDGSTAEAKKFESRIFSFPIADWECCLFASTLKSWQQQLSYSGKILFSMLQRQTHTHSHFVILRFVGYWN